MSSRTRNTPRGSVAASGARLVVDWATAVGDVAATSPTRTAALPSRCLSDKRWLASRGLRVGWASGYLLDERRQRYTEPRDTAFAAAGPLANHRQPLGGPAVHPPSRCIDPRHRHVAPGRAV